MSGEGPAAAREGTTRFEDLDVLVQGRGIRRGVAVEVEGRTIRVGDLAIRAEEMYWTSRRAGLLMLFARDRTLAVKGGRGALEALARAVEARRGEAGPRGRLPEEIVEEVVVCTAGTAMAGRVGDRKTSGLRVGVFTRRGAHLLDGERDLRVGWPVEDARRVDDPGGSAGGPALVLRKGPTELRLLYLYPEEIEAVLRVARSEPAGDPLEDGLGPVEIAAVEPPPADPDGAGAEGVGSSAPAPADAAEAGPEGAGGADDAGTGEDGTGAGGAGASGETASGEELEMFDRREVAGPVPPRLPEFRSSVEKLQEAAEAAADRMPAAAVDRAGLEAHVLETHFLELGETALGPLLLRKSAAATAQTLERALEAMDASELEEDTEAAASNAAERTVEVYRRELDRLLEEKRAPARVEEEHRLGMEEREDIRLRIHAPFEKLTPLFRDLEERQDELRREVEALESGPPGADDRGVREAAEAWRRALARVDRGFVGAWEEVVEEIADVWEDRLLPSLAQAGSMRRRRVPEWALLALLALATLLAAAGVVLFLLR